MPKKDGSGKGVGANKNTGGCSKGGPGHGKGSGRNNGGRKWKFFIEIKLKRILKWLKSLRLQALSYWPFCF